MTAYPTSTRLTRRCVKVRYLDERKARSAALTDARVTAVLHKRNAKPLRPYACPRCRGWHLTHYDGDDYWGRTGTEIEPVDKAAIRAAEKAERRAAHEARLAEQEAEAAVRRQARMEAHEALLASRGGPAAPRVFTPSPIVVPSPAALAAASMSSPYALRRAVEKAKAKAHREMQQAEHEAAVARKAARVAESADWNTAQHRWVDDGGPAAPWQNGVTRSSTTTG